MPVRSFLYPLTVASILFALGPYDYVTQRRSLIPIQPLNLAMIQRFSNTHKQIYWVKACISAYFNQAWIILRTVIPSNCIFCYKFKFSQANPWKIGMFPSHFWEVNWHQSYSDAPKMVSKHAIKCCERLRIVKNTQVNPLLHWVDCLGLNPPW